MTTTEKAMVVTETHWCLHNDCLDIIIPFTSQKDLIQHKKDAHGIYCKISKDPEPEPISESDLRIHTDELNRTHMFYYTYNWMVYITPTDAYIGCPKDVYDKSCKYAPFAISCDYLPPPIHENTDQNIIKLATNISSWMGWCHGDMLTLMNLKNPVSTWIMSSIDAYVLMREHENDNSYDDY